MKKRKIFILLLIILIIISIIGFRICRSKESENEFISIKSQKQLMSIYENDNYSYYDKSMLPLMFGGIPFSLMNNELIIPKMYNRGTVTNSWYDTGINSVGTAIDSNSKTTSSNETKKDYSTTNIQVENVDEADITKTDGNYIYSISEDNVIITNVEDTYNIKVESKIKPDNYFVPEDIILYENKIAIICTKHISYSKNDTKVMIYNIESKSAPEKIEEYTLYSKYYTSRCINGKLFVICSDQMQKQGKEIVTYYNENTENKEIGLNNIKYLKNKESKYQTIISSLDLNKEESVKVSAYLFDVQNAYISENNIYLLNNNYNNETISIKDNISTLAKKGIIGYIKDIEEYDTDYDTYTTIYKFNISEQGNLQYKNKTKVKGKTINQFSIDEYEENLRIALQSQEGSRIVVFDKNLKNIGETEYLSKGEKMYSTRFLGNKAYMVTYKNTDPLYVIDLSTPSNPKTLGELKIPGYSTYLHPYDENHIIGIGMQTEEKINRNSSGKVMSTSAVITGMKMALFDVSDVNNPIQISQTIIGDRRTTSAILTNHKALLFSKEKELLAIPVNKYPSNFEISADEVNIGGVEKSYINYSDKYISEGYFVYNINLNEGFKLKGIIEHERDSNQGFLVHGSYYDTKLLRGLWIENDLFTVSEDMIKVNKIDDLSLISELKLKENTK